MVNTVYLNGTSGNDTLIVNSNSPYVVNGEAGDDLIKVELTTDAGGIYVGYANSYTGGPGNDTIEITGSNSWAAFQAFSPANSVETIKGDGTGDDIVAGQNTSTGQAYGVLDLSATNLINIAQIRGTSANDTITGSPGSDNIATGDGNDLIYESGGSDTIDGGTGTNSFIAKSSSTSYQPLDENSSGQAVFNIGTGWKFADSSGAVITLTNIQSVQFTDETLSAAASNPSVVSAMQSDFVIRQNNVVSTASKLANLEKKDALPGVTPVDFRGGSSLATFHSIESGVHTFVANLADR